MDQQSKSRRDFLSGVGATFGAAWVASYWPAIAEAHGHAAAAVDDPQSASLTFFSADEARDVDAIASQIIPTDDSPGAHEAGAIYFIDRSLRTWQSVNAEGFRAGLKEFQNAFAVAHRGVRFADADSASQISYLATVDQTPFFGGVRALTLIGMFALPQYGGNRDAAGWRLIGFDDQHAFSPPFGYYDRDYPGFKSPVSSS